MTIFKKKADLFKWLCLILAILSLAGRLVVGELYEVHEVREVTGEIRMGGSGMGYLLVALTVVFFLGYIIFNQLSRKSD